MPSLMGLADLHVRREAESAAPLLAEAERLAQEGSLGYRLPEIHRLWAEVHLARPEPQAALADVNARWISLASSATHMIKA
ncbi:MAG TPA: hypothetical protein VKE41_13110 [Roseiflexaceae bacterium]|nr:hypothetical protein [Roseiflexaceae bacterium]